MLVFEEFTSPLIQIFVESMSLVQFFPFLREERGGGLDY